MPSGCATVEPATRRASILGLAPPPSDARRTELADFLKHRRALVTPESAGLEANGRRRTPGLRREEVAQLAGVGVSWYTWLEQGRDIKPSPQVLDALARALRLDAAERAHVFHLARVELPLPAGDYPREAPPELHAVVEGLMPNPAYLIGPRADVLAWNRAAARVIGEPQRAPDGRPNVLWWLFTSDERRDEQSRSTARNTLARFRAEHARRIGDPDFAALVDALDRASPEFRDLWPRHEVLTEQLGTKTIEHPELGTLRLHHLQSVPTSHPDLRLTQFAPADDATRAALARL
ncbi:MAG: family transcriptional regulator [Solirubrobacterales bacterium]|nr:family transcriptional regulator [Solirubrobacterales bacterium]